MGLTGLLLFSLAARPEIQRQLRWRRLHLSANALAALIFLAQGITGPRDLLEIPLSWQKATIWSCDFSLRTCPPLAPPGCSAACCQLIRQTSNMVPWCRRCSD